MVYSIEQKVGWFKQVLRIRMFEEAIADRYSEQKMRCPTHLSIGQEAAAVGICHNLTDQDTAFSTHRAHAHYLAKGGCVNKLIAELYGKETGCTGGRGGSMHLSDLNCGFLASTAIVANSIPLAVGAALTHKLKKNKAISVAFFGDGATEEGAFYEALNFAALKALPVIFACENNGYSVYSSLAVRQPKNREIVELAESIGVQAIRIDGNDVVKIAQQLDSIVSRMREEPFPILVEMPTYRWREHCGPNFDNNIGYRSEAEFASWKELDPLIKIKSDIKEFDWDAQEKIIKHDIQAEINTAFEYAEKSAFPNVQTVKNHIYAE